MANISQKYAQALYDVVENNENLDKVYNDLENIAKAVEDNYKNIKEMDLNPIISRETRQNFVKKVFLNIAQPVENLLLILASNGKLFIVGDVFKHFRNIYNLKNQQELMKVESVYKLSNEELDELGKAFIKRTGLKKLIISNEINKSLIGGVRVSIGTKVYDGSIQNDLNQLSKSFQQMK